MDDRLGQLPARGVRTGSTHGTPVDIAHASTVRTNEVLSAPMLPRGGK